MAKRKSLAVVFPVKDEEEQHPVPTAWRPVFCEIVKAFVRGDYRLTTGIPGVCPVTAKTAKHIKEYVEDYGEELVELPDKTWSSSVCVWAGRGWDVLIDLWTAGEGRSDLVLSARISETKSGLIINIEMVYVP